MSTAPASATSPRRASRPGSTGSRRTSRSTSCGGRAGASRTRAWTSAAARRSRSEGPLAEDVLDARRLSARVEHELAQLPERQRAALCLTAVEGLSYAEVADALEISESAVKALVHRARTALAGRVKDLE